MIRPIIAAKLRNEGLYVIDWLAYHRALGFKDFVIISNDCTDYSDELLDCLQDAGFLYHINTTNFPLTNKTIGRRSLDALLSWDNLTLYSHLLYIDLDEFVSGFDCLNKLCDLAKTNKAIFLPWLNFVSNFKSEYNDNFIMNRNTLAFSSEQGTKHGKLFIDICELEDFYTQHKAIYKNIHTPIDPCDYGRLPYGQTSPYIAHYVTKSAVEYSLRNARGQSKEPNHKGFKEYESTTLKNNINRFILLESSGTNRVYPISSHFFNKVSNEKNKMLNKTNISSVYFKIINNYNEIINNEKESFLPTFIRQRIYQLDLKSQERWIRRWIFNTDSHPEHDAFLRLSFVLNQLGKKKDCNKIAKLGLAYYNSIPLYKMTFKAKMKEKLYRVTVPPIREFRNIVTKNVRSVKVNLDYANLFRNGRFHR